MEELIKALLVLLAFAPGDVSWIVNAIEDETYHYILGSFSGLLVGFLVYYSILITSSVFSKERLAGSPKWVSTVVDFFTRTSWFWVLLAAVSAVALSHYFLDYVYILWNAPLNPPLELH